AVLRADQWDGRDSAMGRRHSLLSIRSCVYRRRGLRGGAVVLHRVQARVPPPHDGGMGRRAGGTLRRDQWLEDYRAADVLAPVERRTRNVSSVNRRPLRPRQPKTRLIGRTCPAARTAGPIESAQVIA